MAKTDTTADPKANGKEAAVAEKPKSVDELLKDEKTARATWYAHFGGSAPVKPYSTEASASLRALEKAKSALVAATGADNFKDAARKLEYKPQYAPRGKKVAAPAKS